MRIVTIIFATILLVATAGLGLLGTNRSIKDAKSIDEIYEPAKAEITAAAAAGDKGAKELQSLGEATGRLRAGAVAFAVAAFLALGLLIMTFIRNKRVPHAAAALVGLSVLSIVLNPQYDLGPTAPASARSLAYVVGVLAGLGALSSWGASRLRRDRAAA